MYATSGEQSLLVRILDVAVQRSTIDAAPEMTTIAVVEPS
jgi:hypothetical protein